MSAPNPSDPQLLLPEWLRDGEAPLPAPIEQKPAVQPMARVAAVDVAEVAPVARDAAASMPALPYSDRLSLDTRLDPKLLVTAEDLPGWLGGLERVIPSAAATNIAAPVAPGAQRVTIEEPEPYQGVDAPEDGVIDVEVNGWYLIAAALGLLVLIAAAARLYVS